MAEATEGLWMTAKERDRLKVLHEVSKRHIPQKQAAVELGLSESCLRQLLMRWRARGDSALRQVSCDQQRDRWGTTWQTPQVLVEKLNRMLIGWANYFCLGAVSKAYSAVDMHARRRLRRWLCGKHNEPRPGYQCFPEASLHAVYGLVQLPHRTASLPWAKT
jgi:hypothetical protein